MKYIKMFGLAVMAAMALAAFVGAGTASATELCSEDVATPCPDAKMYKPGTKLAAQLVPGTEATLTSSITDVNCKKSTTAGETKTTGSSSEDITGTLTSLTFTECKTSGGTACTVSSVNTPYHFTLDTESLTVSSDGNGNPGAKVVCGFLINCTFTTPEATLSINEDTSGMPKATAEGVELERSGGFCPSTAVWEAEYELTSPTPLYIL